MELKHTTKSFCTIRFTLLHSPTVSKCNSPRSAAIFQTYNGKNNMAALEVFKVNTAASKLTPTCSLKKWFQSTRFIHFNMGESNSENGASLIWLTLNQRPNINVIIHNAVSLGQFVFLRE